MTTSTALKAKELAIKHGVSYQKNALDEFAKTITELAGDTVTQDDTMDLLLALKRKDVINKKELINLASQHLRERYAKAAP